MVGIVLASIGLSAAWGEDFPLKVRPLSEEEMQLVPGVSASPSPEKPKGITAEPTYKGALPPRYFQVPLGRGSLTLVFACSDPKAKTYNVVYVDRRGNGNLAQEAPLRATGGQPGQLAFEPVMIELPFAGEKGKGLVQVRAFVAGAQVFQATVAPATCLEGTVRLGTRECRLALIDGNLSGVLGDGEGASCADLLFIDVNGNRTYDKSGGLPSAPTQEIRPLSECWQVGQDWWSATVAGDWGAVALKPVEVEYGELRCLGATVQTLVLASHRYGTVVPKFKDGVTQVPAGEYAVEQLQVTAKDDRGRGWQLVARGGTGEGERLTVGTGAPAELDLSKPLVATVQADARGAGMVQFSLVLREAGQRVISLTAGGQTPAPPTFVIRDEKKTAVVLGKFEFG